MWNDSINIQISLYYWHMHLLLYQYWLMNSRLTFPLYIFHCNKIQWTKQFSCFLETKIMIDDDVNHTDMVWFKLLNWKVGWHKLYPCTKKQASRLGARILIIITCCVLHNLKKIKNEYLPVSCSILLPPNSK